MCHAIHICILVNDKTMLVSQVGEKKVVEMTAVTESEQEVIEVGNSVIVVGKIVVMSSVNQVIQTRI